MRRDMRRRRYRAGRAATPLARRHVFHVIGDSLTPGQANADSSRDIGLDPLPVNAAQYANRSGRADYRTIVPGAGPIWFPSNSIGRISPMERLLIDYEAARGVPVGIVPHGVAGSSLTGGWNWQTPGANLIAAKAAYADAMAKFAAFDGVAPIDVGTIMALSTNDDPGTIGYPALRALWLGLIDDWRAFCGHDGPVYVAGPVNGPNDPGFSGYEKRRLIEQIASERVNCYVVHPPYVTLNQPENTHPLMAENRVWGSSLAAAIIEARAGAQPVPTLTMGTAFASDSGQQLSVTLTHTGLALASPRGWPVITGGADAALFQIGGTFHAPVLQWAGNGTGPATLRDYEVEVSVRNSAWQIDNPEQLTISRAAAAADVSVVAGQPLNTQINESYGGSSGLAGHIWTGQYIGKGRNLIGIHNASGGAKPANQLWVNGQSATRIADYTLAGAANLGGASNAVFFEYQASAEDVDAVIELRHGGSPNNSVLMASVVVKDAAGNPAIVDYANNLRVIAGTVSANMIGRDGLCPAGGLLVSLALVNRGPITVTRGAQVQNTTNATSHFAVSASRDTDGGIDYQRPPTGDVYYSRITLAYAKA